MAFNLEEVDPHGVIAEAHEEAAGDSRLDFLKKGAMAGGAALSGGAILSALTAATAGASPKNRDRPPAKMFGSGDVGILNYALTLEYLESAFYNEAAKNNIAKGDKALAHFVNTTRHDENAHVAALKKGLGSKAAKKPPLKFGKAVTDKKTFAMTAFALENTGVHAYHGQITNIKNGQYLIDAAEIVTVEGRHAGAIAQYLGSKYAIAPKTGFDSPLGAKAVLKIVASTGFIQS